MHPSSLRSRGVRAALFSLGLSAAVVTATPAAHAFSVSLYNGNTGPIVKWPTTNLTYYLHPDCSTDLNTQACLDEVRASFQTWTQFDCTGATFTELGFSNNKQLTAVNGGTNGKNEFAWIENSQWFYGTYTLGVTAPVFYSDGTIIEADIAMNGYQQTWSMSGANYSTDVMNVSVHEIGHFFGMQHVLGGYDPNNPPTMAPTADPFMGSRTPDADDGKGVCFLLPKDPYTCTATSECPLVVDDYSNGEEYYAGQLQCTNGFCGGVSNVIPEGDAQMGDSCVADNDCVSPLFCQQLSSGGGVCASQCQTANPNCPSGYDCVAYSNSPGNGVCLEGDGGGNQGGSKGPGEPCDSSPECSTFLCIQESGGNFCRQPCYSANDCGAGEECMPLQGAGFGACFPATNNDPDPPTGLDVGQPCNSSDECQSQLCAGSENDYLCTQPCGATSQCPAGYICYGLTNGGGGCFEDQGNGNGPPTLETGAPCEFPSECVSGQCVAYEGEDVGFCTDGCSSTNDCPCGMECSDTSLGFICTPGEKVGCVANGGACAGDTECVSGACVDGICGTPCTVLGQAVCGSNQGCLRTSPGTANGLCSPLGGTSDGKPCSVDSECGSLICHSGVCSTPCDNDGQCAGDYYCVTGLAGALGICQLEVVNPGQDAGGPGADAGGPQPDTGTPGADGGSVDPDVSGTAGGDLFAPQPPFQGGSGGGGTSGCATSPSGSESLPVLVLIVLAGLAVIRRRS